jgi:membrane protein implicated in regulation of membrane protease activity
MDGFFPILGQWAWFVLAGILLLLELVSPGVFFLWLAIAAALTGLVDTLYALPWQVELLLFAALSVVSVVVGRKFYAAKATEPEDNPYLNRRQMGYIGRSFTLSQPIVNGRGKLTIEDTVWEVEGPDMAAGMRVKVTAVKDMYLIVTPLA